MYRITCTTDSTTIDTAVTIDGAIQAARKASRDPAKTVVVREGNRVDGERLRVRAYNGRAWWLKSCPSCSGTGVANYGTCSGCFGTGHVEDRACE